MEVTEDLIRSASAVAVAGASGTVGPGHRAGLYHGQFMGPADLVALNISDSLGSGSASSATSTPWPS